MDLNIIIEELVKEKNFNSEKKLKSIQVFEDENKTRAVIEYIEIQKIDICENRANSGR